MFPPFTQVLVINLGHPCLSVSPIPIPKPSARSFCLPQIWSVLYTLTAHRPNPGAMFPQQKPSNGFLLLLCPSTISSTWVIFSGINPDLVTPLLTIPMGFPSQCHMSEGLRPSSWPCLPPPFLLLSSSSFSTHWSSYCSTHKTHLRTFAFAGPSLRMHFLQLLSRLTFSPGLTRLPWPPSTPTHLSLLPYSALLYFYGT